jgi:ubiquitin-activating enzyme E1
MNRNAQFSLHCGFLALSVFRTFHNNQLPLPFSEYNYKEIIEISEDLFKLQNTYIKGVTFNCEVVRLLSSTAYGDCAPIASIGGGFVAHQIFDGLAHTYYPLTQWIFLDQSYMIPSAIPSPDDAGIVIPYNSSKSTQASTSYIPSRYDGIIPIIGRKVLNELRTKKVFLVGAGAIGCEHLKNMALSGFIYYLYFKKND